ncbi:hypothetical protein TKV_c01210 [Thermoanaerobacter kivui]|uniref:Uncharacterized protein n=1 Tax=Thermoanaerobacter kivui TaxID=2325 RepID=A0A097AND1_THEKI|nr:hypothetical protein [Thermoanaerobacter kivui]AIS51326.1 hypothetical protein TKV_c01210 [Thermoanaerobacter kivui]
MLKGIRWQIVLITFAVVFGFLFASFQLYQNKLLPDKISKDVSTVKFVKMVTISTDTNGYIMKVKLDKVKDLMQTYKDIEDKVKKYPVKINILLIDNPNDKLNNIYYNCQFAIYEGIQNGDYIKMYETIKDIANKNGATSYVYIDKQNIYVDLREGSNYFYKVIPREFYKGEN